MKKKNIILATTISTIPLLSISLIPFLSSNIPNYHQSMLNMSVENSGINSLRASQDTIQEPIFYNNYLDATPIFNINNFENIQGEEKLYSSKVSKDVILRLVLNNIEDIFGTSIDAQNFRNHLKKDSFDIINLPKDVCVIFTLENIVLANSGLVGEKEYQIILTGFRASPEAEFTWLIYSSLAIVPGIILFVIIFIIIRRKLKKKSPSNGQIVEGEYVIY